MRLDLTYLFAAFPEKAVAFDIEATSTIPNLAFIFQIYALRYDGKEFKEWVKPPGGVDAIPQVVREFCQLSEDDLRDIDKAAGWEVHGPKFYKFISGCILVAYNGKGYDIPLLDKEEDRVRNNPPTATAFDTTLTSIVPSTLDVLELVKDGRLIFEDEKPRNNKLGVVYESLFGQNLTAAHDASADAIGMLKVMHKLDSTGFYRENHISPIMPHLIMYKLERLVNAADITVTVGPNMIPNLLRRIREIPGLDELINNDLSPLMPSINKFTNTTQYPSDYQPPYHLLHFCALVMVLARSDDFNDASDEDERADLFYKCMHRFIEGIDSINPDVSFFPFAESTNAQSRAANFIDGTLFRILLESMPTAMEDVVTGLLRYSPFARNDMACGSVLAAVIGGDGSILCQSTGVRDPMWKLAIHTNDGVISPYKAFLGRYYSCTVSSQSVSGYFNYKIMCQSSFMIACHEILCIKWWQFMVVCVLLRPLRIVGDNIPLLYTPVVSLARRLSGVVLGANNDAHGVGLTKEWYLSRYRNMARDDLSPDEASDDDLPLLFRFCFGGWSSTDACVAPRYRLYQSNEAQLEGFGEVIAEVLDFNSDNMFGLGSYNLASQSQQSDSTNSRGKYYLGYNERQTAELLLYGGIFDYLRRSQWLDVLVRYLLCTVSNLEYQDEVRDFLDGLLSYIKHVNPS